MIPNLLGAPGMYNGLKVFINDHKNGAYVGRTWKERILSWPWKPWIKARWDQGAGEYVIPNGQFLRYRNEELHCNTNTFKALNEAIDNQ